MQRRQYCYEQNSQMNFQAPCGLCSLGRFNKWSLGTFSSHVLHPPLHAYTTIQEMQQVQLCSTYLFYMLHTLNSARGQLMNITFSTAFSLSLHCILRGVLTFQPTLGRLHPELSKTLRILPNSAPHHKKSLLTYTIKPQLNIPADLDCSKISQGQKQSLS